jgi:hypothetical protein
MFRFKPENQFVERDHSVVSYVLNMEEHISKVFANSVRRKEISYVFHYTFYKAVN